MNKDEIKEKAQRMVDIFRERKNLSQEYEKLREELTPFIDTKGFECNGGKVVLVQGSMQGASDKEAMIYIITRHTTLTEADIENLMDEARNSKVKYRDDYLKVVAK